MLLQIVDGSVSLGGETILSHISFEIKGNEKAAIVGRNGAGKTTLLHLITGQCELDANEKNPASGLRRSRAFTMGILDQRSSLDPEMTADQLMQDTILSGKSEEYIYSKERYDAQQEYQRIFTRFGFSENDAGRKLGEFSGGEQIKLSLISLLLARPDLLILDEPTNHLDLETVTWLERYLKSYDKAVLVVSHDRYFIDRVANVVWEVAGGTVKRHPGNYTHYRKAKADDYARQSAAYKRQCQEIERQNALIEKFKHKPRKASFARSRKTMLDRMEKIEKPVQDDAVIHTAEILPARLGSKTVWECEHLVIGHDKPLSELSLRIRRGQKIGILGANGSGKTTFVKTVAGLLPPIKGKCQTGVHIDLQYFDQLSAQITDEAMVIEWFHDRFPSMTEKDVRTALAGFLFAGSDMGKRVCDLSGGEKTRLMLAALLQERPNFLVLDEPTNNMDIPAKETLESIFRSYKGTLLIVSHDRYLLDQVADSLLIFSTDSELVNYYPFGYSHYMERLESQDAGTDPALLRTAEEQKLISGLQAVPRGERHMLREISTAEATFDWQFSQLRPVLAEAEETYLKASAQLDETFMDCSSPEEYFSPSPERTALLETAQEKVSAALENWTKVLLDWYELYLETLPSDTDI